MKVLANENLSLQINEQGAELSRITAQATGREYLWNADPAYWKRHSPVLFPIVGAVWENMYRHESASYPLSQHGFARDLPFQLVSETAGEVRFRLTSNGATMKVYPFPFCLEIGYKLKGWDVEVLWTVKNTGSEALYFQIGAHPAFYYPDRRPEDPARGFFAFDRTEGLRYKLIGEQGCALPESYPLTLTDGLLPLDVHTFDKDALIFEDSQLKEVTLLDTHRRRVLSLHFTAPVVGLWSPPGKDAPFVCIEPWYGRCDRVDYKGEFKEKDWMQSLEPGAIFDASYRIEIAYD